MIYVDFGVDFTLQKKKRKKKKLLSLNEWCTILINQFEKYFQNGFRDNNILSQVRLNGDKCYFPCSSLVYNQNISIFAYTKCSLMPLFSLFSYIRWAIKCFIPFNTLLLPHEYFWYIILSVHRKSIPDKGNSRLIDLYLKFFGLNCIIS